MTQKSGRISFSWYNKAYKNYFKGKGLSEGFYESGIKPKGVKEKIGRLRKQDKKNQLLKPNHTSSLSI